MKSFVRIAIANLFSFFLILTAFEYTLPYFYHFKIRQKEANQCSQQAKISYVDTQGERLIRDQKVGFFLNPALYYVNSMGFLGECHEIEKTSDEFRVAVIGDSFTASIQVPIENTWPELLQKNLKLNFPEKKIKVFNFATGGHGLDQQNEQLKYALDIYKPDVIIHSAYLGNDYTDSSYYLFQAYQKPHKNFANRNYLVIDEEGKIKRIPNRIDYYMTMNFFSALRGKNTLYLDDYPLLINFKWNGASESKTLKDKFTISLLYNNETFDYISHQAFPYNQYKAQDIALSFIFKNQKNLEIRLNVLRHKGIYFNWIERTMVAEVILSKASGDTISHSKPQIFVPEQGRKILLTKHRSKLSSTKAGKNDQRYPFWRTLSFLDGIIQHWASEIKATKYESTDDEFLKFNFEKIREVDKNIGVPYIYQIYYKKLPSSILNDLQVYSEHLKYTKKLHAQAKNAIFLTIPAAISTVESYWKQVENVYFSHKRDKVDRLMPEKIFAKIARKEKINYSSFNDYLNSFSSEYKESLYDLKHRHFTVEGHKLYEQFVRENMERILRMEKNNL